MLIGLYDIDLHHKGKSFPNLELMQVYTYYYNKNSRVEMLKPKDDELKYSQIFYFKENPSIQIPTSLSFSEDKKQIIGYGFYNKLPQLKKEIITLSPTLTPYNLYSHKISCPKGFDSYLRSSIVRIETQNFGGYKKDSPHIYITDSNFLYSAGAEEFLRKNLNKSFLFYHPIITKDKETFLKFQRYNKLFLNRMIVVDFTYDKEFFLDNFTDKIFFKIDKKESELELNYLLRLAKITLIYKNKNLHFPILNNAKQDFEELIIKWAMSKTQDSFIEFYKDNNKALSQLNGLDSELRLLLKTNPRKIDIKKIDLDSNL